MTALAVDRGALAEPAASLSRLRGLHPGWFGAVMGTAILAVAAFDNPGDVRSLRQGMRAVGDVFALLAYLLAAILLVAYLARWLRHRDAALADLRHPVLGALYGTFPGGLLVLAVMTSVVGPSLLPDRAITPTVATLAIAGGVLALAISVAFGYLLFVGDLSHTSVNGGWFIPPVVTIIIPMALTPLMPHTSAGTARLLLALGYACYGMGLLLFLLVLGLLHDRLVLHPLPAAALAPSLWIGLGPLGVGALGLLTLAHAGAQVFGTSADAVVTISQLAATGLWGFGLWWLAAAALLLARYLRTGPLPFGLGWWAFTFPLGAYTVATITLARAWHTGAMEAVGARLFVLLAVAWLVVATRTLRGVLTGQVWQR